MMLPLFLDIERTLRTHCSLIEHYGGPEGVRDIGLLESDLEDHVQITDFGLARTADDASMTQSGIIAGTPLDMAPEQALGEKLDQRADLFSFGSVLYQMPRAVRRFARPRRWPF